MLLFPAGVAKLNNASAGLIWSFEGASNRAISVKAKSRMIWSDRVIFATVRKSFFATETLRTLRTFSVSLSLAYGNHGATVMQIDQGLYAALYVLGFNFLDGDLVSGEIAEIKGDMTIKLVHPPGEELKFVVELPDEKQMIFTVDRHQIVSLAERWQ